MKYSKEKVLLNLKVARADAELNVFLQFLGDHIAKKNSYKKHKGMDAVYYYLVEKHHWHLAYVRSLCGCDLWFLLEEDFYSFDLPNDIARIMRGASHD